MSDFLYHPARLIKRDGEVETFGEDVTDDDPWEARHAPDPEPGYPETYHCGYCGTFFWDGNRKGHLFNGEVIECPFADEWDQDEDED